MDTPNPTPPPATHLPVMLSECLEYLAPTPGETMVDGTLGLGGHSLELLRKVGPEGRVIGLDRDPEALRRAGERIQAACREWSWNACPFLPIRTDFRHVGDALEQEGISTADGFLFDFGVSSMQLDLRERGFSFRVSGPLDMRMDPEEPTSAAHLINELPEAELARILWEYGEERHSRRIARRIAERRVQRPLETTQDLVDAIWGAYPEKERHGRIHPATRTFQALRIAVNDELNALEPALRAATDHLSPGGRVVVLSYHSLEDRIVKRTFEHLAGRCQCPPEIPFCTCDARETVRILTRKPVLPTDAETESNPRARSAKLRAVEKVP